MSKEQELRLAESQTEKYPTEQQIQSGEYKKGTFKLRGFTIAIENPKDSIRRGVDQGGQSWEIKMPFTYGYLENTIGKDGDGLDVFLGPNLDIDFDVFVIFQVDCQTKGFDEHKLMFGFSSEAEARDAYLSSYSKGWCGFGSILTLSFSEFLGWIENKRTLESSVNEFKNMKNEVSNLIKNPRVKCIKLEGEVIEGSTLLDLQSQAGDEQQFDTLVISIASPGGSVSEGLLIMVWMDALSKMNKDIVTIVTANAYSIASLIMLAANYRLIGQDAEIMVHNPMVPELSYANANELDQYSKELRALEVIMYELYEAFTGLSEDQIKLLMDNETYIDADQAIEFNFADEIANINPRPKATAYKVKKPINMSKTINILHRVIAMVNGSNIVNQMYYDDKGGELEIYQVDPSTYAKGDRTNLQSGTTTLSDGSTLTIEDYIIKEIERGTSTAPSAVDPIEQPVPEAPKVEDPKMVEDSKVEDPKMVKDPKMVEIEVEVPESEKSVPEEESLTMKELLEDVKNLKEMVNRMNTDSQEMLKRQDSSSQFEALASEALETLAKGAISGFKPEAKDPNSTPSTFGKSIFQQMKDRRGL